MREVATKDRGGKRPGRAVLGRWLSGVAAVLMLAEWACGSGGAGSVVGPTEAEAPSAPAALSVAGTWSGGSDSLHLSWQLKQDGESVSGTSEATGYSGWSGRDGRVVGSTSGTRFTFSDVHPVGTLAPGSCSAEFEGTLEVHKIEVPVQPPQPPYYAGYIQPPSTIPRTAMSGIVKGTACGSPFSGMISLVKYSGD